MRRLHLLTIFLAVVLCLAAGPARAQVLYVAPGYEATTVTLPFSYTGGNISPVPGEPDSFYIAGGFFQSESIFHVDLADPLNPIATLIADGTADTGADNVYDNKFGSATVLGISATKLLIADNDYGTSSMIGGVIGQAILVAEDLNIDGDFLDVGEVSLLADPSALSTTQYKGTLGSDGRAYFTTADGNLNGEVLALNEDGTGLVPFVTGLSYGAGIAFFSDGVAAIGNADDGFSTGSVLLASDTAPANGVATDAGETVLLNNSIPPASDLAISSDDKLVVAVNSFFAANKVVLMDRSNGATTDLINFEPILPPFGNFVTAVAFDSSTRSFDAGPLATPGQKMLVHDYSLGLVLLTPTLNVSTVENWHAY